MIVKVVKCESVAVTLMELKLELAAPACEYSAAEAGGVGNDPSNWKRPSSCFLVCSLALVQIAALLRGGCGFCNFCKVYSEG